MKITCELDIEKGEATQQARYKLAVGDTVILHKYESELTAVERAMVALIQQGAATQLERTAKRLTGK